jgi:hypothetical protein
MFYCTLPQRITRPRGNFSSWYKMVILLVLHQDQLPTLPMERERAFNYSIAFANTGRLRLWPLKPM